MAHLLLIDDDPALVLGKVRQAFPAPAHTVAVASTATRPQAMLRINTSC